MRTGLAIALGMALTLSAQAALAQDTQTGTGTGTPPSTGTGAGATGTASGGVDTSASTNVEPPKVTTTRTVTTTEPAGGGAAKADDGLTDHEKVVGHFGVGYLGMTQLPIGSGAVTGVQRATLDAPIIGVRYWLMEKLGIDAGIGFTFFSSSRAVEQANTLTETDGPAAFGLAFHGGLPLAFAHAKHYKFLLVPELNVGFTHRGEKQTGANPPPDIVRTGFRLDVGARVGTEIQFGFIGVPELALQATVGLNFRRQVWKNSQDGANGAPPSSSSDGETSLGTTVQSDPWALFVNNISAIYYFP
jgi:hypothetical protein